VILDGEGDWEMAIRDVLPRDADDLLALEPEELALPLLRYLASMEDTKGMGSPGLLNLTVPGALTDYPRERWDELGRAISESWSYLQREGLIARKPADPSEHFFVTRRGRAIIADDRRWHEFRASGLLPRELLHQRIAGEVLPDFLRGDYESAVFKAFKVVEVAVRQAAGLSSGDIGVPLMRRAFGPGGALVDPDAEQGEREALAHLFAGAIGVMKNPPSHRYTGADDPAPAVEQIMLASHLMRIVDERRKAGAKQ
jgi:uncharacterized protein (TIGR02391 family)